MSDRPVESAATRVPFSAPSEPDEWERTTAGRMTCPHCGEWVYPRRPKGSSGPYAFPSDCDVCGGNLNGSRHE